jgi:putative acetyltransferase
MEKLFAGMLEVVGHIAFSAASIGTAPSGWRLLGPVAVLPEHQRRGIGGALIEAGLELLRARGARGCALVGDPAYYHRFEFRQIPGVTVEGVPDEVVLCLPLLDPAPSGEIVHHPAFWTQPEE